jgi:VanZ family protein
MERGRASAWLWVILFTIVIYATLPVAPVAWRVFARRVGNGAEIIVITSLLLTAGGVLWLSLRRAGPIAAGRIALLGAVGAVYLAIIAMVELTPAEKLHFLYYGLLAVLVYRALRLDLGGGSLLVLTVIVVAVIGLGDEVLQGIIPRRYFEWKDVALNAVSGLLATALIVILWQPDRETTP